MPGLQNAEHGFDGLLPIECQIQLPFPVRGLVDVQVVQTQIGIQVKETVEILDFGKAVDLGVNIHFELAQEEINIGEVEVGEVRPQQGRGIMGQVAFDQNPVVGLRRIHPHAVENQGILADQDVPVRIVSPESVPYIKSEILQQDANLAGSKELDVSIQ